MEEKLKNLINGLDEIYAFYDKIDDASTRTLNEIMPALGDDFPNAETEGLNTVVTRSLGNKHFEDLTQLERVARENGRYKVKVKFFTIDWERMPFHDKPKVLGWLNDLIDIWNPKESEIMKAKATLETGISEINGYLAGISDISDKLLDEILTQPGDCLDIQESRKEDDVICLWLKDFDHPESIDRVYRAMEDDNFFVQTSARTIDWADLPSLEKSFLLGHIEKIMESET